MEIVVAVAVLVALAVTVGVVADRRRSGGAPLRPPGALPTHLDRTDFARPDAPWLVALFSSATCVSCEDARRVLTPLETATVAVVELEFPTDRTIHDRYGIDSVPAVVVADDTGVVRGSFLGTPAAADVISIIEA